MTGRAAGHDRGMREEEELIEDARRSRAETAKLHDGDDGEPEGPPPEPHDPQPWAKTSSGSTDSITTDDE